MSSMFHNSTDKDEQWLVIKLKEQLFGVDISYIESIFQVEQAVTRLPGSSENLLGVINLRGDVVPLLDLRRILGITPLEVEQAEFEEMLELRKQDHIHWVDELKRSIANNEPFRLATDPHQCAFGKWYDNYQTDLATVAFHLAKIEEPHRLLHQTAEEAIACTRKCDECEREECLQLSLQRGAEVYMPTVVKLLEEAKTVFRQGHRKMCVVISHEDETMGLLVDDVKSVERLAGIAETANIKKNGSTYVTHVGQGGNDTKNVLILGVSELFAGSLV